MKKQALVSILALNAVLGLVGYAAGQVRLAAKAVPTAEPTPPVAEIGTKLAQQ